MSDSTIVKPFISNYESKLVTLEIELKETIWLLGFGIYKDHKERDDLKRYQEELKDQIMELTILGGE